MKYLSIDASYILMYVETTAIEYITYDKANKQNPMEYQKK
jgi:hypothetical protein